MNVLNAHQVAERLGWPELIEAIRRAFLDGVSAPGRAAHQVPVPDAPDISLLIMPSWQVGEKIVVKLATVAPGNAGRNLPTIHGLIALLDAQTGVVECLMDAGEVTARRTAAASALAADLICPKTVKSLLVVGAGRVAHNLAHAHRTVREYQSIRVWARDTRKAEAFVRTLDAEGVSVSVADDLGAECARADVIACATMATTPVVLGEWLRPGTHLDLVGAFRPDMREVDDVALTRARGAIYVDTFEGAMDEAGDLLQAIGSGAIARGDIAGDLAALCKQGLAGEASDITAFKSVGTALEDYAGAQLVAGALAAAQTN